ncbi:LacI family DNA-binding transcriptional regulator [Kineococcus rhizosphaerae]|uniref:LacI family transcriptional regulator n=1 Tax=Kineococcus rhizosphaerae TaxID=559628 RepID=A0A2T0R263_9ACTN|nr:LacI family DNA-binding transcriptional regulator [Kineococcus rhizosphaerae]PRY13897.1 LacI family transcriptional regulator [Kineococcus rhizosphaerae]
MARAANGRTVTSKDVARVAGVSQSTVSYVMSGKRPISEKTRRLVQDAIDQLTYQPNAGARALASQRTQVIAVVVPFDSTLGAAGLMAFIEEITLAARQHDHDVLLVTAEEGGDGLRRVAGGALCDAIVVMEVRTADPRAAIARDLRVPTLFIGFPADADGLHCIDFDFEAGARLLVTELAAGRRVAVLGWGPEATERDLNYVPRFRRAAQEAAAAQGVALDWVPVERDRVEAQVQDVLAAGHRSLLVTTELTRVVHAVRSAGLQPGTDLDLVALATDADATGFPVPVTAVSTHPRDVSRQAMAWLFGLLEGNSGEAQVRSVPASITRRRSVRDPLPGPTPPVPPA